MTARDKPADRDPERGWDFVQKMVDEDEIERMSAMSEEEVAAELKAMGYERHVTVDELLARAKAKAERSGTSATPPLAGPHPVPAEPTRPRVLALRASWILAAAVAALVAVTEGPQIVAWLHPQAPVIAPDRIPREQQAALRAETLRRQAIAALAAGRRDDARQELDEARALDPAGESDPRVQEARRALDVRDTPVEPDPSSDRKR